MHVTVIGHFGIGKKLLNGQTVKTCNLYSGLTKYTSHSISSIDTHGWSSNPFGLFLKMSKATRESDAIILLTAQRGITCIPWVLLNLKRLSRNKPKIFLDVIGGWLPRLLAQKKRIRSVLSSFSGIWVETRTMQEGLNRLGLKNVSVIPNFKELEVLRKDQLIYPESVPFKVCTFSRVIKEKGIEDAIKTVKSINDQMRKKALSLDIYGQASEEYISHLNEMIGNDHDVVRYCGCVDSMESVDCLKNYFALLFPTHFYTEGIPGTIIDAYCAGVAVISSKWESFHDVVDDGETGFGYAFDDTNQLKETLLSLLRNPEIIFAMKEKCLKKAVYFDTKRNVELIDSILSN